MRFAVGDILDYDASYLICSGNPSFNMSGGVNAALRERFGDQLQSELHRYLLNNNLKMVPPGTVYLFKEKFGKFLGVTYCVGIDAWYESSIELVNSCIINSMKLFGDTGNKEIALTAIATGYGRLKLHEFGNAMKILDGIVDTSNIVLIVQNADKLSEIIDGYKS